MLVWTARHSLDSAFVRKPIQMLASYASWMWCAAHRTKLSFDQAPSASLDVPQCYAISCCEDASGCATRFPLLQTARTCAPAGNTKTRQRCNSREWSTRLSQWTRQHSDRVLQSLRQVLDMRSVPVDLGLSPPARLLCKQQEWCGGEPALGATIHASRGQPAWYSPCAHEVPTPCHTTSDQRVRW